MGHLGMKLKPVTTIDFKELDKSRSYKMFKQAVKSEKTLYAYKHSLTEFFRYANFQAMTKVWRCPPIRSKRF